MTEFNAAAYWEKRWQELAATYHREPPPELAAAVDAVRPQDSDLVLLDYGCGPGRWTEWLQERYPAYFGYEPSRTAAGTLYRRIGTTPIMPGDGGPPEADLLFTSKVIIHMDDEQVADMLKLARRYVVIAEAYHTQRREKGKCYPHMVYRTQGQLLRLFWWLGWDLQSLRQVDDENLAACFVRSSREPRAV